MKEGQDGVEKEEGDEAQSRECRSRQQGAQLPLTSLETLVQTRRDISRQASAQHVKDEDGSHQTSAACRTQESNSGEADGEEGAKANLRS